MGNGIGFLISIKRSGASPGGEQGQLSLRLLKKRGGKWCNCPFSFQTAVSKNKGAHAAAPPPKKKRAGDASEQDIVWSIEG